MVMFDFLFISAVIVLGYISSLLLNLDLVPEYPTEYELKRRARDGDGSAKKIAWARKHSSEVDLATKLTFLILQGAFILALSLEMKKVWPALLISLASFILVRVLKVKGYLPKMFVFWEKFFVGHAQEFVGLLSPILKPLYSKVSKSKIEEYKSYYSEDEFIYRFGIDSGVLGDSMRSKIERILKGSKTKAKEIMLGIEAVPKVDINLSLTPIIYDELHKKGYDMALVYHGSNDNLVGLLHLSGSEAVEQLNSASAIRVGDKMEQGLQYVTEDVKLDDLIAGFLQGGQNAVLVTGAGGRVSGVITARKLLGWVSGS